MKNIILLSCLMGLMSCASKVRILNTNAVSMTEYSLEKGRKVKEIGEVQGKFCPGDKKTQDNTFGLIDEAVRVAQDKSGADFLTNTVVYQKGMCVSVEGTGVKFY